MVSQRLACQCAGIFSTWSKAVSMQSFLSVCKFNQWQTNTKNFRFFFFMAISHYNTLSIEALLIANDYQEPILWLLIWFLAECDRRISCLSEVEVLQPKHQWAFKELVWPKPLPSPFHNDFDLTCFMHWCYFKKKKKKAYRSKLCKMIISNSKETGLNAFPECSMFLVFFLLARPNKNDHCYWCIITSPSM